MKVKFKFDNGQEVEDIVTGFRGIITCAALWLNGCKRYSVHPKMKEGETTMPDSIWIDQENLKLISEGVAKKVEPTPTGGPTFANTSGNREPKLQV